MTNPKSKSKQTKAILDKPEPYLAIDNIGAFYAILPPEEVDAARRAGRTIVSVTPLTHHETEIAMNNLLNAALESLPGIPEEEGGT
jgi:hypothetical protein